MNDTHQIASKARAIKQDAAEWTARYIDEELDLKFERGPVALSCAGYVERLESLAAKINASIAKERKQIKFLEEAFEEKVADFASEMNRHEATGKLVQQLREQLAAAERVRDEWCGAYVKVRDALAAKDELHAAALQVLERHHQKELKALKELREGDNKLIRALAEDAGIKITAPNHMLGVQWEQFHDGVMKQSRAAHASEFKPDPTSFVPVQDQIELAARASEDIL